jgi:hypothetical protein
MRSSYLLPLFAFALLATGCRRDAEARRDAPTTLTSATVAPSSAPSSAPQSPSWNGTYEFTESSGKGTAKMGTLEEIGETDYVVFVAGDAASPRVTVTSTGVRKMKFVGRGVPRGDSLAVVFEAGPVERETPNLTKGDEAFSMKRSGTAVSLVFAKLPPTGSEKTLLQSPPRAAAPAKKAACKAQFAEAKPIDVVGTVQLKTVSSKPVYVIEPQSTLCSPGGDVVREITIENPLNDMDQLTDTLAELPLVIRAARSANPNAWIGHLKTSANSAQMLRVMDH